MWQYILKGSSQNTSSTQNSKLCISLTITTTTCLCLQRSPLEKTHHWKKGYTFRNGVGGHSVQTTSMLPYAFGASPPFTASIPPLLLWPNFPGHGYHTLKQICSRNNKLKMIVDPLSFFSTPLREGLNSSHSFKTIKLHKFMAIFQHVSKWWVCFINGLW